MKFLHTADWHLGIKTMGKDRLAVQKQTMNEICDVADKNNVDVVIIAGDIYNSSVPSASAEELFYQTIEKLSCDGNRVVIVVSGNHDDPERLCAGLPLAYMHNIVLAGNLDRLKQENFVKTKPISVFETGEGYIKIKKGNEIANIAYLPFDSTLKARPNAEKISYSHLVGKLAQESAKCFDDNVNVLVSHLFLVGGKISRDRTVIVGDAFAVSVDDLPKADYVALGHIHSPQEVAPNIYYSGSTSRLRPCEYNISVNIFEKTKGNVKVEKINLSSPEKFVKVKANSIEEASLKLKDFKDTDLVELTIVQNEPLKASETKSLRKNFPCVCSVELQLLTEQELGKDKNIVARKDLSDKELFRAFYQHKKGIIPRESLVDLFISLRGEKDETN